MARIIPHVSFLVDVVAVLIDESMFVAIGVLILMESPRGCELCFTRYSPYPFMVGEGIQLR